MDLLLNLDAAKCFSLLDVSKALPPVAISAAVAPPKGRKVRPADEWSQRGVSGYPSRHNERPSSRRRQSSLIYDVNLDRSLDLTVGLKNGTGGAEDACRKEKILVQPKCSTKCSRYGGIIPAILQALDMFEDLDEAFGPWEDRMSCKERSIILKEQSSWERAWDIFEWFKRKRCYEANVIHYNIMLRILGRAQKWGYVEQLWDEMIANGVEPVNSTYGTLIDAYSKGGRREVALAWLGKMNKQGMVPDEVTMGIIVQMYKKAGEFGKAENFFKKWSNGGFSQDSAISENTIHIDGVRNVHLSSQTYNTLIDTYGKAGQIEEASDMLNQMLKEGILPTTVTLNTLIHMNGNNGKLEELDELMGKMEELRCVPDTRTYNILISIYTKLGDIYKANSYFEKMKKAGLEPDVVSYRTLLRAYSTRRLVSEAEDLMREMNDRGLEFDEYTQSALLRMYIDAGMLEKSWSWFMRFHLKGDMSSECYAADIDAYGQRGLVEFAERAFFCREKHARLTLLEFNVMIKAYGIANNHEKACQLFDSMESQGVEPDKCSYNSLIQILSTADLPRRAMPYLKMMQEAGLVSDCIQYCALMSNFVRLDELETAEDLYKEMLRNDVPRDIVVYGVLINAFAEAGNIEKVTSYVDEAKEAGLTLNNVIYNSLIKLYTKVGHLREAEIAYRMLQSSETGADVYSSNCMIDLYSKRAMLEEGRSVFRDLKNRGIANEFTYVMMLCLYRRIGRTDKAFQIAKRMREFGLLKDPMSYNQVLGVYILDGRIREAAVTFKEMNAAGISPDDSTFRLLGLLLTRCGISKHAIGKMEVSAKRDLNVGIQAYLSALSAIAMTDDHGTT
ncbi:hypothetical protein MLD38_016600 [Melastoma candidum]|uniref:Uncharacterized protein n=1 Tax=Melastoma candidum TaxID=119954 RepID=A0ACB9QMX2_9MYRT|nr:hypothetical protein MLD38_016600 [Melastoma candidum]